MPPLPSTVQSETSNLIEALARREKDLLEVQIPRLRNYKGTLAIHQRYAAELRGDLDTFQRDVATLEALSEDHDRDRDRREVARKAQEFAQILQQMKKDARAASLISKRAVDSLALSNRDELLRSTAVTERKPSDEKSGDALMNASNDVTETLRRTIGLMQSELEKSVLSTQMLEQSSSSLRSTTVAHDGLSTLLSTSKHLITALEKSDWLDRLLIISAVAFFFLVVLYILKQRVLDKGLRLAFWWTRYLPDLRSAQGGEAAPKVTATTPSTFVPTVLPKVNYGDTLSTSPFSDPLTANVEDVNVLHSTSSSPDQILPTSHQPDTNAGIHYREL